MLTDRAVLRSRANRRRGLRLSVPAALMCLALVFPGAAFADDPKPPTDPQAQPAPPADPGADAGAAADEQGAADDSVSNERAEAVIAAARAYIGTPYRVGTEGPDTIDCSGLVFRAFSNASELGQVGGSRLRAAGYLRWFAQRDLLTTDVEQAERGDLVIYGAGEHIGIYLGDGRVISALVTGVMVHSLAGITIPPTGFLAVDWSGKRGPFKPGHIVLPTVLEAPEAPAALVPATAWMPAAPDDATAAGPAIAGTERTDMRTANSRTFQTKDGRLTTEVFSRPIFYLPEGSTEWQPIDLRFLESKESEDGADVTSSSSPVSVSLTEADSDSPLVSLTSGDQTLALEPAGIQHDAPALELGEEGRHGDYRDLLADGVGLRVFPRADGFKSFLVLGERPASRTFRFNLDTGGLTPVVEENGSLTLHDESGAILGRITRPMLLDSSDIEGDGGGVRPGAVTLGLENAEDGASVLTLTVGKAALEEAVYPAYVDLGVVDFPNSDNAADHTFVSSSNSSANFSAYQRAESPGYAELWHGRRPERRDDNEAYLRFPGLSSLLSGSTIESAGLAAFPYLQNDAEAASGSWVGVVAQEWDARSLTWDGRPEATLVPEMADTTQGAWSDIDLTTYVQDVVTGTAPDYGLVLHADAEGRGHWKRFVAETTDGAGALEPRLVIHWSNLRPMAAPTNADVEAGTVSLSWTNASLAPAQSRAQVQLSTDDFAKVADEFRLNGKHADETSLTLALDDLAAGTYSWRVRVRYGDSNEWSAWSDAGTFGVRTRAEDLLVRPGGESTGVDLAGSGADRTAL